MYPKNIQELINIFSKFPSIGPRTASRFVFYLLKLSGEEIENIVNSIKKLKKEIKLCNFCFNPFQDNQESSSLTVTQLCDICKNPNRNKDLLCIVEKESEILSLEKTKKFKGRYFILGGTISAFKKKDLSKLRIKELEERINENSKEIKEIILAMNSTTEGEATALYLERLLRKILPIEIKITRLGRGLPVGGELEYADEETLSSAIESRR